MRHVVSLFVALGCIMSHAAASQVTRSGAAGGQLTIRACAVLTRELVTPFTENKKILDLIPPEEEMLGTTGTACEFGDVRLQLYPGLGGKGTVSGADFQPISGPGYTGYFRNNRNRYAELMIWTPKHSLTLQIGVPTGGTAEAMRPDVIKLSNAIIAKLP